MLCAVVLTAASKRHAPDSAETWGPSAPSSPISIAIQQIQAAEQQLQHTLTPFFEDCLNLLGFLIPFLCCLYVWLCAVWFLLLAMAPQLRPRAQAHRSSRAAYAGVLCDSSTCLAPTLCHSPCWSDHLSSQRAITRW